MVEVKEKALKKAKCSKFFWWGWFAAVCVQLVSVVYLIMFVKSFADIPSNLLTPASLAAKTTGKLMSGFASGLDGVVRNLLNINVLIFSDFCDPSVSAAAYPVDIAKFTNEVEELSIVKNVTDVLVNMATNLTTWM